MNVLLTCVIAYTNYYYVLIFFQCLTFIYMNLIMISSFSLIAVLPRLEQALLPVGENVSSSDGGGSCPSPRLGAQSHSHL